MKLTVLSILLLSAFLHADRWSFFYPQAVTHISCSARLISQADAQGIYYDKWEAEAKAKRNDPTMGDWAMTVAIYPGTQTDGIRRKKHARSGLTKLVGEYRRRTSDWRFLIFGDCLARHDRYPDRWLLCRNTLLFLRRREASLLALLEMECAWCMRL